MGITIKKSPIASGLKPKGGKKTTVFAPDVFEKFCMFVAGGDSITDACKRPGMPVPRTIYKWMAKDDSLKEQFKAANEVRLESHVDAMMPIATNALNGCKSVTASDRLRQAELKIKTLQWIVSKGLRHKYGNESTASDADNSFKLVNSPDDAPKGPDAAPKGPANE